MIRIEIYLPPFLCWQNDTEKKLVEIYKSVCEREVLCIGKMCLISSWRHV